MAFSAPHPSRVNSQPSSPNQISNPWDLLDPKSLHDREPPPIILPRRQKAYRLSNPPSPIPPVSPVSPKRSPGGSFEKETEEGCSDDVNSSFYNRPSFIISSPNPRDIPMPNPSWSLSREGLYQTRLKNNQKQINDKRSSINIIKNEALKNISYKSQHLKKLSSTIHNLAENDPSVPTPLLLNLTNEIIAETIKIKEYVFEIEELVLEA